jgi:histidine phosphotransfer protein HptB
MENCIELATFDALKESMGADFIGELLTAYFDETPMLLKSLQNALAQQDCEAFQRAAHSIKSTSNTFGALGFGNAARELEMMGKEKNLAGAEGKVTALSLMYEDVKQGLESLNHGE